MIGLIAKVGVGLAAAAGVGATVVAVASPFQATRPPLAPAQVDRR